MKSVNFFCLLLTTTPLCVRLNFKSSAPPGGLRLLLTFPIDRVAVRGFFFPRVLFPLFLERVSGDESEDCGERPWKLLPWVRVLCRGSGGWYVPPEEAGESGLGSGVLRGVGEVLWSSSVSPARRSIIQNRSSMLLSAGTSTTTQANISSTTSVA